MLKFVTLKYVNCFLVVPKLLTRRDNDVVQWTRVYVFVDNSGSER